MDLNQGGRDRHGGEGDVTGWLSSWASPATLLQDLVGGQPLREGQGGDFI